MREERADFSSSHACDSCDRDNHCEAEEMSRIKYLSSETEGAASV